MWIDRKLFNPSKKGYYKCLVEWDDSQAHLVIEKGAKVESINLSLQEAKHIGLINFDALKPFCK